jgi:lipopolysaccharide/colanic/teichoic acid biosynthesis glycosyltransferase
MSKPKMGITLDRSFALGAFILDLVIVFLSIAFACFLRFGNLTSVSHLDLLGTWAFYSLVFVLLADMEGLYFTRTMMNRGMLGYRAVRMSLIVTLIYTVVMFLFRLPSEYFVHSRLVVVISFFCLVGFYVLLRILVYPYVFRFIMRPLFRRKFRVLVFGDEKLYGSLRTVSMKSPIYRWFLDLVHVKEEVAGNLEEKESYFLEKADEYGTNDLCICDDSAGFGDFARSAWSLHRQGMFLSFFSKIFENFDYFDTWLYTPKRVAVVFFAGKMSRVASFVWRVFEIAVAFAALLLLLPFMLLIALAVKLESKGPVLFKQDRVGLGMEHFAFPKFRSMTYDPKGKHTKAHKEYFEKYANGKAADPESSNGFKLKGDSRVTRVGKVLRRTSLDELPQLWCVLTGKMSLVGPRPCIPYELEHYSEWQKLRFTVKPGLTGIWQVYGRSRLPMDAAQFMDFCYVMNRSVGLNVRLILKTVPIMMVGRGGV